MSFPTSRSLAMPNLGVLTLPYCLAARRLITSKSTGSAPALRPSHVPFENIFLTIRITANNEARQYPSPVPHLPFMLINFLSGLSFLSVPLNSLAPLCGFLNFLSVPVNFLSACAVHLWILLDFLSAFLLVVFLSLFLEH